MNAKIVAKATTHPASPSGGLPGRILWIVGGLLAIVGLVAYGFSLASQSMAGTSSYPWGIYIALFYTVASGGAGLLIVGGVVRVMRLATASQVAQLFGIACALLAAATILVMVDLGNPSAVMAMYLSANMDSPIFFDGIVLPICIAITVIGAIVFARPETHKDTAGTVIAVVAVVAGFALIGVEAWLLSDCSGKDAWGVLLGAGPALLQAIALALAIVVLTGITSKPWRALMAIAFLTVGASLGFDVLLNQGTGSVLGLQFTAIAENPLFVVAIVCALAAALVALLGNGVQIARVAAGLGVLSIVLFKVAIIWGTQTVPAVTGVSIFGSFPFSLTELLVVLGVAGIAILVYAAAQVVLAKVAVPQEVVASSPAGVVGELEFQEVS